MFSLHDAFYIEAIPILVARIVLYAGTEFFGQRAANRTISLPHETLSAYFERQRLHLIDM